MSPVKKKKTASVKKERSSATKEAAPRTSGAKHVLMADDDPALSHVMQLKFRNAGFEVTVCHNGQEAIDALNRQKYDCLIFDLIMPQKTGFDVLLARQTSKNKTTPAFVMSDMRTQETIDQVMALGATNFFVKMQMPLSEVIDVIQHSS